MKDAEARTDGGEEARGERRSELMEGKRDGVVESADFGEKCADEEEGKDE